MGAIFAATSLDNLIFSSNPARQRSRRRSAAKYRVSRSRRARKTRNLESLKRQIYHSEQVTLTYRFQDN